MCGGSKSSSSSTNTTQTTTQDQKVSATDSAIALGQGAALNYTEQFPDNVAAAFGELIQFARDSGEVAINFAKTAISNNQAAMQTVADQANKSVDAATLQKETILKNFIPYAGVALIVFVFAFSKKGKK